MKEAGIIWLSPLGLPIMVKLSEDQKTHHIVRVIQGMLDDEKYFDFLQELTTFPFLIFDNFADGKYTYYWITPSGLSPIASGYPELFFKGMDALFQKPDGTVLMNPSNLINIVEKRII
ncbi:MAG: hypothetical protein QXV17_01610 [Candidatus Micrarchaeaceae archaeon]